MLTIPIHCNFQFTFHTGQMKTRMGMRLLRVSPEFTFHTGQMKTPGLRQLRLQGNLVHIPHRSDEDKREKTHTNNSGRQFTFHTGQMKTVKRARKHLRHLKFTFHTGQMKTRLSASKQDL